MIGMTNARVFPEPVTYREFMRNKSNSENVFEPHKIL
jgi:hypothetical protein